MKIFFVFVFELSLQVAYPQSNFPMIFFEACVRGHRRFLHAMQITFHLMRSLRITSDRNPLPTAEGTFNHCIAEKQGSMSNNQ